MGGRLSWISSKLALGHQVWMTHTFSRETGRTKVKFIVGAEPGVIPKLHMLMFRCAIESLTALVSIPEVVVMDRGHKHSDGRSEICLWLRIREEQQADGASQDVKDVPVSCAVQGDSGKVVPSFGTDAGASCADLGGSCSAAHLSGADAGSLDVPFAIGCGKEDADLGGGDVAGASCADLGGSSSVVPFTCADDGASVAELGGSCSVARSSGAELDIDPWHVGRGDPWSSSAPMSGPVCADVADSSIGGRKRSASSDLGDSSRKKVVLVEL